MNPFKIFKQLATALTLILHSLRIIQRKLDALLAASPRVSAKQLRELQDESELLKIKTDSLAQAIEKQK